MHWHVGCASGRQGRQGLCAVVSPYFSLAFLGAVPLFVITRATDPAMVVFFWLVVYAAGRADEFLSLVWAPFCSGKSKTKSCSVAYLLVNNVLCRVMTDGRSHV
jgi:hypothetical protein